MGNLTLHNLKSYLILRLSLHKFKCLLGILHNLPSFARLQFEDCFQKCLYLSWCNSDCYSLWVVKAICTVKLFLSEKKVSCDLGLCSIPSTSFFASSYYLVKLVRFLKPPQSEKLWFVHLKDLFTVNILS